MATRPGERIRVQSHTVGTPERWGTILERRETGFLLVEWDDGHESMFLPSMFLPDSDIQIIDSDDIPTEIHIGCQIEVRLDEAQKDCEATATITTGLGAFTASGLSRHNPTTIQVPWIGAEISISRALQDLAQQIGTAASEAIEGNEDGDYPSVPTGTTIN